MLNLCVINGSPRRQNSNSSYIVNEFSSFFEKDINIQTYYVGDIIKNPSLFEEIINYDNLLIASSLYADSYPSTMLDFLWKFGDFLDTKKNVQLNLYCIVNSGFIEGYQNKLAVNILKSFAIKNNLTWKIGLGFGSGEMLKSIKSTPWQGGPKKPLYDALIKMKNSIQDDIPSDEDILLVSLKCPKRLFMLIANHCWKVQAKKEFHLRSKELYKEIY